MIDNNKLAEVLCQNLRLSKKVKNLEAELISKNQQIMKLREQIVELNKLKNAAERASKRQASPFGKGALKKNPKQPGRIKGKGKFIQRKEPEEEHIDRVESSELTQCPHCDNSTFPETKEQHNYQLDVPSFKPFYTLFKSETAFCPDCGKLVTSRHPEQLSTASGSCNITLGPRIIAIVADMHEHMGCSYEKIADFVSNILNFQVNRSSLCKALTRLAEQAEPVYKQLINFMCKSSVVHADETGWKIDTLNAWLWVFTNKQATVYTIRSGKGARAHDAVIEVLGASFGGVLVSDCFVAYDVEAFEDWIKQKCIAHLLKDLKAFKESVNAENLSFAIELTALLKKAIQLKNRKANMQNDEYLKLADEIEKELDNIINTYDNKLSNEDVVRFRNRIIKQRKHIFTFLYYDDVDPTNNLAEQMLRPAVISRKTQHCNKTVKGAIKHSILSSISATLRQQKKGVVPFFEKLQLPFQKIPNIISFKT